MLTHQITQKDQQEGHDALTARLAFPVSSVWVI